MHRSPEHLRPQEISPLKDDAVTTPETLRTYARATEVCAQRQAMLASIEAHIGPSLHAALSRKIRYERATLFESIGSLAKRDRLRSKTVLKTEYFVQRPLDVDIF